MIRNFKNRLCSRNTMYKRDIMVRVWNSAMYRTFDVRVTLQKEYDVQKHMIIAQN
jgi:hypothetical protein